MITYKTISLCAKRALAHQRISFDNEGIYLPEDSDCIIIGQASFLPLLLYRFHGNRVLIEEEGSIHIPHDFDELDRKLSLFG